MIGSDPTEPIMLQRFYGFGVSVEGRHAVETWM
jgi:hypothetical protein